MSFFFALNQVFVTGPTVYFQDDCTDTNGTNWSSHTPNVGSSPTYGTGVVTIQSNKAQRQSGSPQPIFDYGHADYTKTLSLNRGTSTFVGAIVRYSNANNYWLFFYSSGTNVLTLYEVNGGTQTSRATGSVTLSASTAYNASITCTGNSISMTINGVTVSYASASFNNTATKGGIYQMGAGTEVDTILVTS